MRRVVGLLAVALLVATLLPFPAARASMGVPVWSVGDSWTYLGSGFDTAIGSGAFRYVVVGTDLLAENGDAGPAYHVQIWANATGAVPRHVADEWYRTSDLAVVRLTLDFSDCTLGPSSCTNSTVSDTVDPILPLRFPLSSGDAWSSATVVTTRVVDETSGLAEWFNYTGGANDTVGAVVRVSVPAGNFTATPLTEVYSGNAVVLSLAYAAAVVRDFSPAVGNAVAERDYSSGLSSGMAQEPSAEMELVAYSYTAPAVAPSALPTWAGLAGFAVVAAVALPLVVKRLRSARRGSPRDPVSGFPGPRERGRGPRKQ